MIRLKRLRSADPDFRSQLNDLLAVDTDTDASVTKMVSDILADVRARGDAAVIEYTNRFDRLNVKSMDELVIPPPQWKQALESIDAEQRTALEQAAERVRRYHEKQKADSWSYTEDDGTLLGQKVTPLDRVGLYVPGGKAAYPSSVIMNAIPAKVAGVSELIMVVPTPDGVINDMVLAAAAIVGVDKIFAVGGAQAIAALAYGTDTILQVDKIVGPGNIYVATAKRMVFGKVGIDMIAGPSEVLIICDGQTDPDWIAMDMFAQAEHDENARSILLCPNADYLNSVAHSIERLLPDMERADIIKQSLESRGALIEVGDIENNAIDLANFIAPEHLELSVDNPESLLDKIRHAGAVFMGRYSAEALGDYCAGPNHVLPTERTARFSSPLGVYDFQKRSSLVMCSEQGASELGKVASTLAEGEGLQAHARSARYRIKK